MTGVLPDQLVNIVDTAMAEAVRRGGKWIACRPGCSHCCLGPFPISSLDARRLRQGLAALDGETAERVRRRAWAYLDRHRSAFPGDAETGILDEQRFEREPAFAADEPCPALDPSTGTCDLYAARPLTCRTFGPAIRVSDRVGTCELCYQGATEAEIEAGAIDLDTDVLEAPLLDSDDQTIVAFALL